MNIEHLREYCLKKKGVSESFPFGEETLVFKVGEKVFLLTHLEEGTSFNAKCDPDWAVELREQYEEVQPGYHMNKKHWNTVRIDGRLSTALLHKIIDQSYDLVAASLPKKAKAELGL